MRPNLALAISLLGVAIASLVVKAQEHPHEAAGKEVQPDPMVEGYSVISSALYKDDLEAAKKAAGRFFGNPPCSLVISDLRKI